MGWLVLILIIGIAVYLATKKQSSAQSPEVRAGRHASQHRPDSRTIRQAHSTGSASNGARPRSGRTPTYTRERTAPNTGDPRPWNSEGREIPFAEPGLHGPLFHYGGTSLRHGSEHDGPFAVIDFETTGLSPKRHRIVEVAVARVDAKGRIEDEFATLVNPQGRDVGPTFIHGITNAHVKQAPTFAEVAPELLSRMSGAVVVAHNATFEEAFLSAELRRAGIGVATIPALCTLWLGRQTFSTPNHKLGTIARAAGVPLVDKHAALGDVRAVAALLPQMTSKLRSPVRYNGGPIMWSPAGPLGQLPLVTRAVSLRKGTDGWMHSLVARLPSSGLAPNDAATEAYLDALSEALADGRITGDEAKTLAHLAGSAGMGGEQVSALNKRFLDGLKIAALDDDVLTTAEIRQLTTAAKALSLPDYFGELRPTPAPAQEPRAAVVPSDGTTASNSMEARAERGTQALELQRSGSSRSEIAVALGVSQDTVKALLRDAKFYENPESDPSRLGLARHARQARNSGITKDVFQNDRGISSGKSTEAWRDAAMLSESL
ncbi:exonuclease domain-containing protein [Pimelobacter simplex]|uniref:exonuclease domain-containing protein n=1 Tax=Nocardioides simplex TaxID=2045 RepID=UPI001934877B|nr:3'-5' exonuclease [Pimelobacter simplex]